MKRALFVTALFLILPALLSCKKSGGEATLRGGEIRETLNPAFFTEPTRTAYAIAMEIPEVIDSLYCYCECKENFGHKSLLTCYVDEHAVNCGICQDEVFMAYELHKGGYSIPDIRKAVDERYSTLRH